MTNMWRAVQILLAFYVTFAAAQDCMVYQNGVLIQDWTFIFLDNVQDDSPAESVVGIFTYESVNDVIVTVNEGAIIYVDVVKDDADKTITIKLNDRFPNFENNEGVLQLAYTLVFTCANALSRSMGVASGIVFTNNNSPIFENQNNLVGDGYEFTLPIPFPAGVSITSAYNEIIAFDIDIDSTATKIEFELVDPSNSFKVSPGKVVESSVVGKFIYYANLQADTRFESTTPVDLKIIAKDVGGGSGGQRISEAPIRILIDTENSEPFESSAFTSLLYIVNVEDTTLPPGPLTPHEEIKFLTSPEGPVDVEVLQAPGVGVFYAGLFTAAYDEATQLVTLSRAQAFTPEQTENEALIIKLKASQTDNDIFQAETIVHVNLPTKTPVPEGKFTSSLYTAAIVDPNMAPGDLLTNEEIVLENPPAGTLVALEAPISGAPWVVDQFAVAYDAGKVTLSLAKELDASLLAQESINLLLKATELTANFEATTLIQVDLPAATQPPDAKFSSLLYTAKVTDVAVSEDLVTNPTPIQIENVPDGDIEVMLQEIEGENFVADQFSVVYTTGGQLTLKYDIPLQPGAQDLQYVRMLLKASNAAGFEVTTIVVVDLPQKEVSESSGFGSALYTSAIEDPLLAADSVLETNPKPISIVSPPAGDIQVELVQLTGEEFVPDQFSVEYQEAGGVVILKLKAELTAEALALKSVHMLLKAKTDDGTFEASTVVHVDLPQTTPPVEIYSFSSLLYTSVIEAAGMAPGDLESNPTPISIINFPDGDIVVELDALPNEPFVPGQFAVEYKGDGQVTLKLAMKLTAEALQNEVLHLVLRASKADVNFEVTSVISVNIPQTVPIMTSIFASPIYSSIIDNHEMAPGDLITNPEKILIENVPDGEVAVVLQKIVGEPYETDQFSVAYKGNGEVSLTLLKTLTEETLAYESMSMLLLATHENFGTIKTVINIDIPTIPEVPEPGKFDNVLHTTVIVDGAMTPGVLPTNPKIMISNPPSDFTLTLLKPPGVDNSYESFFSAARVDQTGEVALSLAQTLTSDPLGNEVVVLLLRADNADGYVSETLIQVDMPTLTPLPPGDPGTFTSVIYISAINDPEFIGDLPTDSPITLTEAPDDAVPVLQAIAVAGVNSYVESFNVRKVGDVLTVFLVEKLPAAAFDENTVLVMTILATSIDDPAFKGETVLHVTLPAHTCPEVTTPTPTTCLPCIECPPCTTTTPTPPSTITFTEDVYTEERDAGFTGQLFTVKAKYNNQDATFEYGIDAAGNSALVEKLSIDPVSGAVTVKSALVPGKYSFRVSAKHESGDQAFAPAIISMLSTSPCTDGLCFPYALLTMNVPEGQDQVLISGNVVPTCKYYKIQTEPLTAEAWFNYEEASGELSITKDADVENDMFNMLDTPQVRLILEITCDSTQSETSHNTSLYPRLQVAVTRSQMLVVVTLEDVNDNSPTFPVRTMTVAYPKKQLARQLLPGPIVELKAIDADQKDSILYGLKRVNDKVEINSKTGSLYPVDGKYDYVDTTANVAAYDPANKEALIDIEIRHVAENQVAVLFVSGKVLEDIDQILIIINDQLDDTWSVLQSAVLAEYEASSLFNLVRNRRNLARAGETGGLVLVLCALPGEGTPLDYKDLKSELESLDMAGLSWTISSIETWSDAIGIAEGGDGGTTDTSGLEAAVITLGVLTGLFAIALVVLVYITVFRKRQQKKMKAKSGFKNRTSFSGGPVHRDSVAVQKSQKQNQNQNGLHPEWTTEQDKHDKEQEERRKSMVTFSDETEVIPTEVARL